jgi:hypothetical protein
MGTTPGYIHTIAYAHLLYCLAWFLFNGVKLSVRGWLTFGFWLSPRGTGVEPCGHPTRPLADYRARLSHGAGLGVGAWPHVPHATNTSAQGGANIVNGLKYFPILRDVRVCWVLGPVMLREPG